MSYYPSFQNEYTHEELVEHFWLHSEEIEFVESFRSEINKQTVAVLLKSLEYLGGFPESLDHIPEQVRGGRIRIGNAGISGQIVLLGLIARSLLSVRFGNWSRRLKS
jgi:hypothetical protein